MTSLSSKREKEIRDRYGLHKSGFYSGEYGGRLRSAPSFRPLSRESWKAAAWSAILSARAYRAERPNDLRLSAIWIDRAGEKRRLALAALPASEMPESSHPMLVGAAR